MQLTDEQLAIVDAARENADLCVLARAGTGKTSTNVAISEDQPDKRFLYLAFNKRVADEGKRRFGSNVTVKTAHSLAFGAVGRHFGARIKTSPYQIKDDLSERFATAWQSAGGPRDQEQLALYAALQAIDAFTASAASELDDDEHVAEGPYDRELVGAIARGMSNAMSDPGDWSPVTHDVYLKIWQLALAGEHDTFGANTRSISADTILFDEFQDASPAMLDICIRSGVPTIGTGDPRQCLPEGTMNRTADGVRAIETVVKGDFVMSACGDADTRPMKVVAALSRDVVDHPMIVIRTARGHQLAATPNHIHFAEYERRPGAVDRHFVYLMERDGVGFRVGRA